MSVDDIERLSTKLVQDAPARDPADVAQLVLELRAIGSPLALAIARIVEYVDDGLVDPAIALPALAEACATLVAGVKGQVDDSVLEAARYQIDTLTPMPDKPPRVVSIDVPIIKLRKKP
ncbi:MAG: hypothetical protein HOV81_02570 [Kofleriaceae bacterium]|nr:hypothetical protein [Kofleriaceae bacterium]